MTKSEILAKCIESNQYSSKDVIYDVFWIDDTYSCDQILYALSYYKSRGIDVPSMQWLMGNMDVPCSLLTAENSMANQKGNTLERNKRRIKNKSKAEHRKSDIEYLFTEAG